MFKENKILMNKPNCLGYTKLELTKLIKCECYYDVLQLYFGSENIQLH